MGIVFVVLSVVIGGYSYLTDSEHVRVMAQDYLSKLMRGRVEIGRATLSIFEGLRVDDVKVSVDPAGGRPDALLFSAQSLVVNYDPRQLVGGRLDATEIVAQKPHVYLTFTQSAGGASWNYERLGRPEATSQPVKPGKPVKLSFPELLLRNAEVEIGEVRGGRRYRVGSMAVDGQFTPGRDGEHYQFELQSRGVALGPFAKGTIDAHSGEVKALLKNVEFGEDMRSMFPADLRDWWERHELAGRIESVDVTYAPARGGRKSAAFAIETEVKGITLAVRREEWSGRADVDRLQRMENAISLLRGPYEVAGYRPVRFAEKVPAAAVVARAKAGWDSPVQNLLSMVDAAPVLLRDVSGTFVFTQDGIDVRGLTVGVGTGDPNHPETTNTFRVAGRLGGYRPESPAKLEVESAGKGLYFPAHPTYLASLPREVREFYEDLGPEGTFKVRADVNRETAGAVPQVSGVLEVVDATFVFRRFAYPLRGAGGKIAFGRDPFSGKDYLTVMNMHASGMDGGPNEGARLTVSGRIGPLGPDEPEPGVELRATGTNVCSEPSLMRVMPWDVAHALRLFDAPGKGELPEFRGNFACNIVRPVGHGKRFSVEADLDLADGAGRIVDFPYPCEHVEGKLKVYANRVEIKDLTVRGVKGEGPVAKVKGHVRWADEDGHIEPLDMDIRVAVRDMPLDENLITSIPSGDRDWLRKLGAAGMLSGEGRIYTVVPANWRETVVPGQKVKDPPCQYDLAIGMHDGTIWPAEGLFSVSEVAGTIHLTRQRLDIIELHGRREGARVSATGAVEMAGASPTMSLTIAAKDLALDRPLYAMLPVEGRRAWDELQPAGTIDARVEYEGPVGAGAQQPPASLASAAAQVEVPAAAAAAAARAGGFRAVIGPRDLRVRLRTAPYPLTFTGGSIVVSAGRATLKELRGAHGPARLVISGEGSLAGAPAWDLNLHAEGMQIDAELRRAVPPALLGVIDGLKLQGALGLDLTDLRYRGSAAGSGAEPDIDVAGTVTVNGAMMDAGVPLTDVNGSMKFTAATRRGRLEEIAATLAFPSLSMGGRAVRDLGLELTQLPGRHEIRMDKIRGRVAGGELAGGVTLMFPEQGANRYTMNLTIRNADVRELTGESDQSILGELTASLALEGAWGDAKVRRGRGDVVVAGKQLYRIPLLLGVLQVTNLSMPIGGPFTKGTARYTVEGTRINFEQMDLRSDTMMMSGTGYLDFATKQVRMNLATDNPGGLRVPFIHELWQGARQELLRITVRGTVQDPKVEANSLATFTTTIDQVFKGEGK